MVTPYVRIKDLDKSLAQVKLKIRRIRFNTRNDFFIIDDNDFSAVNQYKWYLHGGKYVRTMIDGKQVYLHRFLMTVPKGKEIDHINGNPRDNRRSNLRIVTRQQNLFNSRAKRKGLKGVCYDKTHGYYVAWIMKNRKAKFLGSWPTELLAAKTYDKAARELFGIYARTNFKLNRGKRHTNQGDLNGTQRNRSRDRQIA